MNDITKTDHAKNQITHNGVEYCLMPVPDHEGWVDQSWSKMPGFVGEVVADKSHIDGFGHVNNMVYPNWAMEAAWQHSDRLGFPFEKFNELGVGFVIHRHEFDYKAPVLEGQRIQIATWVDENDGRMKLIRAYEIRFADTGRLVFKGKTLFICVDMKTGRPARMPPLFAQTYQTALESSR